ncbi:hypothetical protein Sste5344_007781 [Sporothrix stenoceras]
MHRAQETRLTVTCWTRTCAPNLRLLELSGMVSSKTASEAQAHLNNVDELYLGHFPMTTTSFRRLTAAIGLRLADVSIDPPRQSPRPADNLDDTA